MNIRFYSHALSCDCLLTRPLLGQLRNELLRFGHVSVDLKYYSVKIVTIIGYSDIVC